VRSLEGYPRPVSYDEFLAIARRFEGIGLLIAAGASQTTSPVG